jgi:hypothetical protein
MLALYHTWHNRCSLRCLGWLRQAQGGRGEQFLYPYRDDGAAWVVFFAKLPDMRLTQDAEEKSRRFTAFLFWFSSMHRGGSLIRVCRIKFFPCTKTLLLPILIR